ncbi:MAG: extracellular solute-binding protein [Lachnospiraceae bacterium]|jgi:ABC-type tungstate transport system permease subunit|nr:extracellular solute-binding protein [Lachnospiraceae bacterium]
MKENKMKRAMAFLMAGMLAAGVCACGSSAAGSSAAVSSASSAAASAAASKSQSAESAAGSSAAVSAESTAASDTASAAESQTTSQAAGGVGSVGIQILYEKDDDMKNTYSLEAVNPDAPFKDADSNPVDGVAINSEGAKALIHWLTSEEGENLEASYGKEDFGESLFTVLEKAPVYKGEIAKAEKGTKTIRLSTTTSVNDSGLLDYLLPVFEKEYGYDVEVASAGTGKAIAAAEAGNADLILVHSKKQEEAFIEAGYSMKLDGYDAERISFMYNYFVLCGPSDDPAKVREAATVKDAFKKIADGKYPFVSRGDKSGTHSKEVTLWPEDLGITTDQESIANYTDWYNYSNAGMGACLMMANEKNAYILSDKATFLTFVANEGNVES